MLPEDLESKFVNGLNLERQENWWFLHILATFYRLQFLSNIQSYDKFSGYCVFVFLYNSKSKDICWNFKTSCLLLEIWYDIVRPRALVTLIIPIDSLNVRWRHAYSCIKFEVHTS